MGVLITHNPCGGKLLHYDNGLEEYVVCKASYVDKHHFCEVCFAEVQRLKNENSTLRNSIRATLFEEVGHEVEGIVDALLEAIFDKKDYSFKDIVDDEYLPLEITIPKFSFALLLNLENEDELIQYLQDNKKE